MDIQVKEVKQNPLLKRREVLFTVTQEGAPDRVAVKEKLAALHNAKFELTFVRELKTRFGKIETAGTAMIYDNEEAAKIEPSHIKVRNVNKENRDEAKKAAKKVRKKKKKE